MQPRGSSLMRKSAITCKQVADEWQETDDQRCRSFGKDMSVQRAFGPYVHVCACI